ncbi:PilZ domain-containing protein [Bdellovibrio sp. HCB337]|uniref:PilZ domain-containing protein n=1 Tax=Bdellovibrio sp. HCB337 TaxID=3394358 RepID=UPI0039A562A4
MSAQQTTAPSHQEWYILRGEMKYGPYEYSALIHMIQTGELFDYNYVWAPHMESWMLLGDLQEFSKDRLARLIQTQDHLTGSFIKRGSPRIDVDIDVYAHNDANFFDGKCKSISENGALVLLNDPLLLPGQEIVIHFRSGENNPTGFNVKAEVIRKNFTKQRINVKSGLHYAVRFLQVQKVGQDEIKNMLLKK